MKQWLRRSVRAHRVRQVHDQPFGLDSLETRCLLSGDGVPIGEDDGVSSGDAAAVVELFEAWSLDDFASIDGTGNNELNPDWGSTDEQLLRLTTVEYADGVSAPTGDDRPSAREVSNAVAAQDASLENDRYLTDLLWLWGQFIDHDIDLTENADPAEPFPIEVPAGDVFFDPFNTGDETIDLNRSTYDETTGTDADNPRQQINQITSYIDGSVIYGSDAERAAALRTFEGGRLATSEGDLLPFNEEGLPNANANPFLADEDLFLAGDVRANENAALTAMHTLWVREHNAWADQIAAADPTLSDEEVYQRARAIVTAELQAITFNEFLPALLGEGTIAEYAGYDPTVNAGIANVFSTALYRLGHSLLSSDLLRLNDDGTAIDDGSLSLAEAFFAPGEVIDHGIDSLLLGAATQVSQELDNLIIDDVRNFLFGQPGSGGFDLASLNIQRGRDHGLADYNQTRVDLGLDPVASFADITPDLDVQAALEAQYGSVDEIDVWVGALAEDHAAGASVGELIQAGVGDQFERLRDGDRYWYENVFAGEMLKMLDGTTLADVIARNTDIDSLQDNVFFSPDVLYFEAGGHKPADVVVSARDGQVRIMEAGTRRVLASAAASDISQVMLVGAAGEADRFTIDMSPAMLAMTGGVVIEGGDGGRDVLRLRGTPDHDVFAVQEGQATINGMAVTFGDIERIRIDTGRGDDEVVIDEGMTTPVVVDGERHHCHDHRQPRPDSDPVGDMSLPGLTAVPGALDMPTGAPLSLRLVMEGPAPMALPGMLDGPDEDGPVDLRVKARTLSTLEGRMFR